MTYAEALTLKAAIEAALLTSATSGVVSVSHNNRSTTYASKAEARAALAEINRSIQTYKRKSAGQNPQWRTPRWR
jgi:hypothetical protein